MTIPTAPRPTSAQDRYYIAQLVEQRHQMDPLDHAFADLADGIADAEQPDDYPNWSPRRAA